MTKALLKMFFNIRNVVQKALQKCKMILFFPEKKTKAIELGTKANSNMSTLTFRACKSIHRKKLPICQVEVGWECSVKPVAAKKKDVKNKLRKTESNDGGWEGTPLDGGGGGQKSAQPMKAQAHKANHQPTTIPKPIS